MVKAHVCHASSLSSTAPTVCRSNRRARRWPDLTPLPHAGRRAVPRIVKARAAGRTLVDAPMRAAVRIRHGQPRPPEARSTKEDTRKQLPRPAPLIGLIELGQQLSRRGGWRDHGHRCRRARPLGGAASGLRIAWHFRASMVIMVRAATNPEESAKAEIRRIATPRQKLSPNLCWLGKMRRLGQALHKHARWRSTNSQCVGLGCDSPRRLCPAVRFTPYLSTSTPASTHQRMALIN